jgi:vitamin B12 transporter
LIGFVSVGGNFSAANVNRARTSGLELSLNQPLGRSATFIASHAFINTSSSTGPLVRRPKFVSTADLLLQRGKIRGDLGVVAQGRRFDNDFAGPPSGSGRGPGFYGGFARVDLTLGYELRPQVEAYVRFGNLLNKRYDEAAGFPAPRFNVVVGLQTRAF